MYKYEIKEEGFRADGYYCIKVKCQDGEDIYNIECVYGKKEPSKEFKIKEIKRRVLALEKEISNPIKIEESYIESEVTDILIEKGYLREGEKFSRDMATKEEKHGT